MLTFKGSEYLWCVKEPSELPVKIVRSELFRTAVVLVRAERGAIKNVTESKIKEIRDLMQRAESNKDMIDLKLAFDAAKDYIRYVTESG